MKDSFYRPAWRSFYKLWLLSWLIFPLVVIVWRHYSSSLTITDKSLILRKGILSKESVEVSLQRVQAIEVMQSLVQRIFCVGSLRVGTAATGKYEIEFYGLGSPNLVVAEINRASKSC